MSKKTRQSTTGGGAAEATRREQGLCVRALESGEFDRMSDKEWVLLCEVVAKRGVDGSREKRNGQAS